MEQFEFNALCQSFKCATHIVQWGSSDVWKVGGKVFAIGSETKDGQPAFTFKTSDLNFEFLSNSDGYIPAPYFANRGMKWIQQIDTTGHLDEELKYYLSESYRIISQSLSSKVQKELGIKN